VQPLTEPRFAIKASFQGITDERIFGQSPFRAAFLTFSG
jgi:hypothetical protein